jgi:hypothetical protein
MSAAMVSLNHWHYQNRPVSPLDDLPGEIMPTQASSCSRCRRTDHDQIVFAFLGFSQNMFEGRFFTDLAFACDAHGLEGHEARTDWSMLLGSIFLLIVGAGAWSVDNHLKSNSGKPT